MSIISVRNVSYQYHEAGDQAVRNVSFDVEEGEFVAVLGSNGSGKSTLAKLINALFIPSEGTVTVCGMDTRDETKTWDVRAACGMVFQNPDNQIVATIVEEDAAFGLENLGVEPAEIRRRVDWALDAVGMSDYAQSAPHMLYGGQKQRVAIAGVVAMKPRVIVFDESTAMLDPVGRREVMQVVRRLNKEEGITILWITHFMDEAALADRIIIIDRGEKRCEGAPRAVFRQTGLIRESALDVPEMTALAAALRERGVMVSDDILTVDEMEAALKNIRAAH